RNKPETRHEIPHLERLERGRRNRVDNWIERWAAFPAAERHLETGTDGAFQFRTGLAAIIHPPTLFFFSHLPSAVLDRPSIPLRGLILEGCYLRRELTVPVRVDRFLHCTCSQNLAVVGLYRIDISFIG